MTFLGRVVLGFVVVAMFATAAAAQKKNKQPGAPAAPPVVVEPAPSAEQPPPPAPPAGPAPSAALEADGAFVAGKKLYGELEYEQAVFRFQEVALRQQLSPVDRGIALTWLGVSYAGTGDLDAARRTFVDAARAEKSVELPVEASPPIVLLFAEAKKEAATLLPLAPETPTAAAAAPPPPPQETAGGTNIAAAVGTAAGGALVVAGVGLAVLCALSYGEASNRDATQLDAKAALDTANLELAGASLLLPVGAVIGGVSTYFLVVGNGAGDGDGDGEPQGATAPSVKSTTGRTTAPAATSTTFVTSRPL